MPDFGNFIKVIQVGGSTGGGPYTVATDTPTAGQTTVTDTSSGNSFVIDAPSTEITGQFVGTSTTFAGLPNTDTLGDAVSNGDFALLTADDGGSVSGFYVFNGTVYQFAMEIADTFQTILPAVQADVTSGTVVANSYVQSDTLKVELDKKVNITSVADAAALTAFAATLTAGDEGKELAYQEDTDALYMWNGTAFAETGSSDNFATADLTGPVTTRVHTFDQALQIVGDGQKTFLSDDGTGRHTLMSLNNGISSIENINTTGANDAIARYEGRALPASVYSRITATDPNTDITSQFETIGDELRIYTPAIDGETAEVNQVLVLKNATTGQVEYEHGGKTLLFIDETTLAPAIAGEPTSAEVTAFIGTNKDRYAYYTSTDTSTDDVLSVYYADKAGTVIQIEKVQEEGLRGSPVADNAALTALPARDDEYRKVAADGKEYVFEFGAVSGTLADDATTGFWQEQIASGLVTTYIDSSAGATVETLAASTAAGVVRLFTTEDVTNSATLAVAVGETLNGVTDATFLFSNYAAGTQFRADEVAGGWVVSVVGASNQETLERESVFDVTGVTFTETLLYNTPQVSNGESSIYDGTLTRHGTLGTARFKFELDSDNTATLDFAAAIPVGSKIVAANMPIVDNSAHEVIEDFDYLRVNDTSVSFNRANAIDAPCDMWIEITFDGYPDLLEQKSVLAGMLAPETLAKLRWAQNSAQTISAAGENIDLDTVQLNEGFILDTASLGDHKAIITKAGYYNIRGAIRMVTDASTANFRTELHVNGVAVSKAYQGESTNNSVTPFASYMGYLDADDEVQLFVSHTDGGVRDTNPDGTTTVYLEVEQLPTSTVVMPDALEVTDLHRFSLGKTLSQGTSATSYPAQEQLTWPVPLVDTAGGVTGNTYVIPADGTWKFKVAAETDIAGTMDGNSTIQITVNGTEVSRSGFASAGDNFGGAGSNDINYGQTDVEVDVVAGDIIEAHVSMSQGISITGNPTTTYFQGRQLSTKSVTTGSGGTVTYTDLATQSPHEIGTIDDGNGAQSIRESLTIITDGGSEEFGYTDEAGLTKLVQKRVLADTAGTKATATGGQSGASTEASRADHQHPSDGVSIDADNALANGSDGKPYYKVITDSFPNSGAETATGETFDGSDVFVQTISGTSGTAGTYANILLAGNFVRVLNVVTAEVTRADGVKQIGPSAVFTTGRYIFETSAAGNFAIWNSDGTLFQSRPFSVTIKYTKA